MNRAFLDNDLHTPLLGILRAWTLIPGYESPKPSLVLLSIFSSELLTAIHSYGTLFLSQSGASKPFVVTVIRGYVA